MIILHTLYHHCETIIMKPPGTPYSRVQTENSVKVYSNPIESFAAQVN